MLVVVFVVLFTAILGIAWRRVASALRVEHVSEVRKQCDQGSLQVLASAMKVLETRLRVDSNSNLSIDATIIPGNPISVPLPQSTPVPFCNTTTFPGDPPTYCRQVNFTYQGKSSPTTNSPTTFVVSVDVTLVTLESTNGFTMWPSNPP
jgi:hypothetical protein